MLGRIKWMPLSSQDGWRFYHKGCIAGDYDAWVQQDDDCRWLASVIINGESQYAEFATAAAAKRWARKQMPK